jgi:AraC-like DNA-binding protein
VLYLGGNGVAGLYYIDRMQNAVDYIEHRILDELSLEEIANVAGFSKFHFCVFLRP